MSLEGIRCAALPVRGRIVGLDVLSALKREDSTERGNGMDSRPRWSLPSRYSCRAQTRTVRYTENPWVDHYQTDVSILIDVSPPYQYELAYDRAELTYHEYG